MVIQFLWLYKQQAIQTHGECVKDRIRWILTQHFHVWVLACAQIYLLLLVYYHEKSEIIWIWVANEWTRESIKFPCVCGVRGRERKEYSIQNSLSQKWGRYFPFNLLTPSHKIHIRMVVQEQRETESGVENSQLNLEKHIVLLSHDKNCYRIIIMCLFKRKRKCFYAEERGKI